MKQIRSEKDTAYTFFSMAVPLAPHYADTSELCLGVSCPRDGQTAPNFLYHVEEY